MSAAGPARGQAAARHRRAHRPVHRVRGRPAGGGAGRDRGAVVVRPADVADPAGREAAAGVAARRAARRASRGRPRRPAGPAARARRRSRRRAARHRLRAAVRAGAAACSTPRGRTSATALQVSTWSFAALARACSPLLGDGASYVGLDFDARVAWPSYDWMGVAKAGLESACRYLARDLGPRGVRVNLVAAGPLKTMAAKSVPGFAQFEDVWDARAPLGWDVGDAEPVARACVALLQRLVPEDDRPGRPRRRRVQRRRRLTPARG